MYEKAELSIRLLLQRLLQVMWKPRLPNSSFIKVYLFLTYYTIVILFNPFEGKIGLGTFPPLLFRAPCSWIGQSGFSHDLEKFAVGALWTIQPFHTRAVDSLEFKSQRFLVSRIASLCTEVTSAFYSFPPLLVMGYHLYQFTIFCWQIYIDF